MKFILYKIRNFFTVFYTSARLDCSPGMLTKGEHFKPSQWVRGEADSVPAECGAEVGDSGVSSYPV